MPTERAASPDPITGAPWLAHYEPEVPQTIDLPEMTLPELFENTAREYPTNVATIFFRARLSYAQLDEQASRFASALQSLGVGKGDRVAIALPNCPQFIIALFGVLKAGAIAVPVNPASVARELSAYFNEVGVETVVTLDTAASRITELMGETPVKRVIATHMSNYLSPLLSAAMLVMERREIVAFAQGEGAHIFMDLIRSSLPEYERHSIRPGEPAVLLYTGGTTGTPRAAVLTHANLVANALQMNAWLWDARQERREVFLGAIPFFHSYGLTMVLNLAISVAASIVLMPRFNIKELLAAIARFKPTIFPAVPAIYGAIAHHPLVSRYDLRSIRVCISGAAPLPIAIAQAFESVTGARLVEGYGLTEASPVTHCNPVHGERRIGSIGLPVPSTCAEVVDDSGRTLGPEQVGELRVRGPQVMVGYWNRPEETAEVLQEGWLLTGDMARHDEDGYFYIVDRKKDLVLVNGLNVYPREVEEVLRECDKVQDVVVAGVPDERKGEIVKAYVVLRPDTEVTGEELRRFAAERLAAYKVPAQIEYRESLPRSAAGKYLRRELVAEELARAQQP